MNADALSYCSLLRVGAFPEVNSKRVKAVQRIISSVYASLRRRSRCIMFGVAYWVSSHYPGNAAGALGPFGIWVSR